MIGICALLAISGCSVRENAIVKASSGSIPEAGKIQLVLPEGTQANRIAFHSALENAFAEQGRTIAEEGEIIADFALSTIGADEQLYFSEAGGNAPAPKPVVDVRKGSIFDGCVAVRTRAKLVAYERRTGKLVASSEAEAIGCEDGEAPFAALAALLVDQVSD